MAPRRFSVRFRVGFLCAVVAIAGVLTVRPLASQDVQLRQVKVPSIAVPRVQIPQVPVVGPSRPAPAPLELPVMSREQVMAYAEAAERGLSYLPGQVLVKFRAGAAREGRQRALSIMDAPPDTDTLEWIGEVALLKNIGPIDPLALSEQLRQQADVEFAEPNYLRKLHVTPNDPSFIARQWNLTSINMTRAWDISPGGTSSVIVAVIDSGVTSVPLQNFAVSTWNGSSIVPYSMPAGPSPDFDLARLVLPRDFTISTTSPPAVVIDRGGHGTHVAGTIGENTNNSINLAGIAYNVRIMPLKVCTSYWDLQFARSAAGTPGFQPQTNGTCPDANINAALRFAADNGAKVINMSLGGGSPSQAMLDALNYAVSKGVFIAISNGNDFEEGNDPSYPGVYASQVSGIMSVAATNRLEKRSYYSNTGTYTEIAAPGGDTREGNVVWQASINQADASSLLVFPRFDRYQEWGIQGTSMASPHVAGIAALLASRQLDLGRTITPAQIESILRQTAKDIGAVGKDNDFGYGLIQPFAALFGQGIIR